MQVPDNISHFLTLGSVHPSFHTRARTKKKKKKNDLGSTTVELPRAVLLLPKIPILTRLS